MSAVQRLSPSKYTRGSSPAKQPFSEPKLGKNIFLPYLKFKNKTTQNPFEIFRLLLKDFHFCAFC